MEPRAFGIEYQSDTPEFTSEMREKVQRRLEKLAKGCKINVASVAIHTISDTQPREYRIRIGLQMKEKTATVIEKGTSIPVTLARALDVLERQCREHREKKRLNRRRAAETIRM